MNGRGSMPPPLELRCLQALWALGEANVRGVQAAMADRKLAYTTVMTVLDRLVRRGGVERRKMGRAFVYAPLLSREAVRKMAVTNLVDCFFGGSSESLKKYLDANGFADAAEERKLNHDATLDAALL